VSENDLFSLYFGTSVLGGRQWPNWWFNWQFSPVLSSWPLRFLWAVPRDVPGISAKETSS